MEEIKEQILEWDSYLPQVKRQSIDVLVDNITDLAVSKERERRDAQIIEFINSGEPAPWNDTGWSVELSDVEKFIKNTK